MNAEKLNTVTVCRKGKEDKYTSFGGILPLFFIYFYTNRVDIQCLYILLLKYPLVYTIYTIRYTEHAQTNEQIILNFFVDYYPMEKAYKQLIFKLSF
jgi:hypothetical protein